MWLANGLCEKPTESKATMNCFVRLSLVVLISGSSVQQSFAEQPEHPVRSPSTGVLPIVDGVASLTIAGTNYWEKYRYEDGEQPQLSAHNSSGDILADGYYHYEFVSIPTMDSAENTARPISYFGTDGQRRRPTKVIRGRFVIESGVLVIQ